MTIQQVGRIDSGGRPAITGTAPNPAMTRIVELDGLRGLMTIIVVLSHFFAEVPHGWPVLMGGWIAVIMFFVLSGYLVGNLVLERKAYERFFQTFYIRRVCRTLPIYVVCVVTVEGLIGLFADAGWIDADHRFPLLSYLTFFQTFDMIATGTTGAHWLAPTWTLAMEEHFYLLAPALLVFVPVRFLGIVLLSIAAASILARAALVMLAPVWSMAGFVLILFRADVLIAGLLLALALRSKGIDWQRYDLAARIAPILLLVAASLLRLGVGDDGRVFSIFGPTLVAAACALFMLTLIRGAPEAVRFRSPVLRFFGRTSYAVYLTHLAALGLLHGAVLGTRPDVSTLPQIAVTIASLPVTMLIGWLLTLAVEEPITAYGRSFGWGKRQAVLHETRRSKGS